MHDGEEEKKTLQVLQANISSRLQHTVAFIIYAYQSVFASVFFVFAFNGSFEQLECYSSCTATRPSP